MKTIQLLHLLLITGMLSLLAACGRSEGSINDFTVSVDDNFRYSPSTFSVRAGQPVTLTFQNKSSAEHSFNILKGGEELEHVLEEAHDEEALHEELFFEMHAVAPGNSETRTFTAPSEPGEYAIFCSLPGHAQAGEVGTMKVNQ